MRPPPGPTTSVPLFGDLPLIGLGKAAGLGPPPHVRMSQLAAVHGDVMTLQMGQEPWVVLSSPAAVHEAFVLRGSSFSGRPMVPSMKVSSGDGKGFARPVLDPELKALRRTAMGELFSKAQVARTQESLEAEAKRLAEDLVAASARDGSVALRPALRKAVTNMVLRYTFGAPASADPLMGSLVEVVDEIWALLTASSTTAVDLLARDLARDSASASALSTLAYGRLPALVAQRDAILAELIHQRRQDHEQGRGRHGAPAAPMVDLLLGAGLSDDDVHYTLVDMFVAGVNTVTTALEWMMLLLAKDPVVQERARADALRSPSTPYVDAVLCEVLRFKPPLLLPRTATCDSTIGGFDVRKGTVVLANNHALTSSERWWRAAHLFSPDRFLNEESHLGLSGGGNAEGCKFIPFSIGQRVCPGSRLAISEMQTTACTLLRTVRWRRSKAPIDLSEEYSLTLLPTNSQRLRFERVAQPTRAHAPAAARRTAVPVVART